MEKMLGAISTASTAMGRPSTVTRQTAASRSRAMKRIFSRTEVDASLTSHFMAGGPVEHDGLPVSSERVGLRKKRTELDACPTGLPARWQRRWQPHRKLRFRKDFLSQEKRWGADGWAILPAIWYQSRRQENRLHSVFAEKDLRCS